MLNNVCTRVRLNFTFCSNCFLTHFHKKFFVYKNKSPLVVYILLLPFPLNILYDHIQCLIPAQCINHDFTSKKAHKENSFETYSIDLASNKRLKRIIKVVSSFCSYYWR